MAFVYLQLIILLESLFVNDFVDMFYELAYCTDYL